MKKIIFILFALFCLNGFAEESAVNPEDPNLRLNSNEMSGVSSAEKSKTAASNVLVVTRKTGLEIEQKLLESTATAHQASHTARVQSNPNFEAINSHSFQGNIRSESYSQLLDDSSGSEDADIEQTSRFLDSQGAK